MKRGIADHSGTSSTKSKVALIPQGHIFRQGFNIKVWLSNRSTLGRYGADPSGNPFPPDGYGLQYPDGSGIEHLFGAGPWIGAIVDTASRGPSRKIKAVTTGYEGWGGPLEEMFGHTNGIDSFYLANIDDQNGRNKRRFDDDNDGKIDEDELDGVDNDGDWNPLTDDLGIDGLPDSLEVGCIGVYDPVTNPDPAFDNYDPSRSDLCVTGSRPMNDKIVYTQNNGLPNTGEPHVDEDYAATSESDAYVAYYDIYGDPSPIPGHVPLGIKIWQKSYAWRSRVKSPILPFEFYFVNINQTRILDSVYVGFFADCDVGPVSASGYFSRNSAGYLEDVRTAYIQNTVDRPSTPVGITVLGAPKPLDSLRYTFEWYPGPGSPTPDLTRYTFMSKGTIKPDEFPNISDTRFFFSFGPITKGTDTRIFPGDTLKIAVAIISGEGLKEGQNNLRDNAAEALNLYTRGWTTRPVPPSPPLRITRGNDRVSMDWKWRPGDLKCDPLQTWDDSDKFIGALPDTHWRRRNPELRCPVELTNNPTGGRVFEGFRVWRSESPIYNQSSFALLKQYDVRDDLHFEYDTDLQYTLTDSNLVRGRKYWYAVTSFSIPGNSIVAIPDTSGIVKFDTLISPPVESDFTENAKLVILPFEPSETVGKVIVVPNPYRTDADYTFEAGGWEGVGRFWTESKRVIWFIHLPSRCTIRIFGLTGDLISTLEHDDATRTTPDLPVGQQEWNLVSESGRAIASGVYVFTVESEFGRQVGKFVVIR